MGGERWKRMVRGVDEWKLEKKRRERNRKRLARKKALDRKMKTAAGVEGEWRKTMVRR